MVIGTGTIGEPLIGFKYKDLDWDASLAQMALFSSEDSLDKIFSVQVILFLNQESLVPTP